MEAPKKWNLTEEGGKQLQEGISLLFSRWSEIQVAVNNGWGGTYTREKAVNFESSVFSFCIQPNKKGKEPLDTCDLEDLLYEGMDSLGLIPGDGIVEEVAGKLMIMREECLEGNYQSIERLRGSMPVPPHVVQVTKDSDDDSDEDTDDFGNDIGPSMMVDSSNSLPNHEVSFKDMEVEEWMAVSKRKKGKGKGLNDPKSCVIPLF